MAEDVNHPDYYGGEDDPYEVIKVLEAWDLELAKGFCWGNLIKYTARAGKKGNVNEVTDRLKAEWYGKRLATITATLEGRKSGKPVVTEKPAEPYTFPSPPSYAHQVLGDELTLGTVVKDNVGDSWTKLPNGEWGYNGSFPSASFLHILDAYGPLTVHAGEHAGRVYPKP